MNNMYVYTGSPINPKFTVNIGDAELRPGEDFDVEISDNINVGTAHVTIIGKGAYTGLLNRTFEIIPAPARELSFFADNTEFVYSGQPCRMQVAVRYGDILLAEGVDYDIEYLDNIEPGTANARLTFKGNFTGAMMIPFTIASTEAPDDKWDDEEAQELAEDEIEPLVNTTEVSALTIPLGQSVQIRASAAGGTRPYTFCVLFRKMISQKWVTIQDYAEQNEISVTPERATRYMILVKVKDDRGYVERKIFKIVVTHPE